MEKREIWRWTDLNNKIQGIHTGNQTQLENIYKNENLYYGFSKNLETIVPIVGNILNYSKDITEQNTMNKLMIDSLKVAKELANQVQIANQASTNENYIESLDIVSSPINSEEMLVALEQGIKEQDKNIQNKLKEINKNMISYNKQVTNKQKALACSNASVMQLQMPESNDSGSDVA